MTFRKSSTKPLISDFRNSFRIGAVPSVFAAAFLIMLMNNYSYLKHYVANGSDWGIGEYRYFFFEMDYMQFPVKVLLFGFGALMGIMAFLFVNSKKMSNVFLSFNIKRSSLFINRCISSIIYIFLTVLIPMIYFLLVNIHFLGFEPISLVPWFYLLIAFFTHALIGFAVAVLAAICAGSVLESGLYSFVFLLTPLMVLYSIEMLLGTFLHGYPTLHNLGSSLDLAPTVIRRELGIYNKLSFLNPFDFLAIRTESIFQYYNESRLTAFSSMFKGDKINIGIAEYAPILLWLAISVGLLFFATFVLNKRRAENAGSFGKNKAARSYAIGLSSVFIFSSVSSYFSAEPLKAILLSIAAFVVVYFIFELIILRSFRELKEGLIKLPIMLGAILLILLIPLTGGFSYSKKLPAASEVESVEISHISGGSLLFSTRDYDLGMGLFTSEKDIDILLSLHQDLIDEGYVFKGKFPKADSKLSQESYYVQYKLKDGKSLERFYQLEGEQLKQAIISVADSDHTRAILEEYFLMSQDRLENLDINEDFYNNKTSIEEHRIYKNLYNVAGVYSEISAISLFAKDSSDYEESMNLNLSADEVRQLKQHILNDYFRLGAEKILYPTSKSLGSIVFNAYALNREGRPDADYAYDKDSVSFNYAVYPIQLIEEMTETIGFLQEKDLMKFFDTNLEIVAAGLFKPSNEDFSPYMYYGDFWNFGKKGSTLSSVFYFNVGTESEWRQSFEAEGMEIITDKNKIELLFENSYMSYIPDNETMVVQFVMSDSSSIMLYLPGDKVLG